MKEVNQKIRRWIYGDTQTPFVVGERVVCRNPIVSEATNNPVFMTNEEAIVADIQEDEHEFKFGLCSGGRDRQALPAFSHVMKVWRVSLVKNEKYIEGYEDLVDGGELAVTAIFPKNANEAYTLDRHLVTQAKANSARWRDRFEFIEKVADLRSVYALTAHSSQGSTFGHVFIDVPNISICQRSDLLTMQKLLYVSVTRASKANVLIGV